MVAGSRTNSGKPLLANDPHLRLTAPSIWYLVHLALEKPGAQPLNMAGASIAGMPLIVLGRTDTLAWGFTNTGPDVQDVFIEKINPDNRNQYQTPDGWRDFETTQMAIAVNGVGVRNVERRRTRHGPVLPGFYRNLDGMLGEGFVAALQWTALSDDDTTIAAGMLDGGARGIADYIERMRQYVVPMQSMVIADADGHIGLIAPGRVPVRDRANRVAGRMPVPGWDATYDWKGYLKFEDLPRFINHPGGALGTANARIVPRSYPHFLTYDWDAPFRQQRLVELIFDRGDHDMASMRAAQNDAYDPAAARLCALDDRGGASRQQCRRQRARPAHHLGQRHARRCARAADLHGLAARDGAGDLSATTWTRPPSIASSTRAPPAMIRLLEGRATGRDWCDDRTTPEREKCSDMLARALGLALADLEKRYGKDRSKWRWDMAHYAAGRAPAVQQGARSCPLFRDRGAEPRRLLYAQPRQDRLRRGAARSPTGTARACAPSTTSPISTARCTCRAPGSRATRCRRSTARSPSAGPRATTSRSRPSARRSTKAPSAPGSCRRR